MTIKQFIKKEPVLCVSGLLACISCFFVKPGPEYLGYVDFRTLALLFCLMTVVQGIRKAGVFDALSRRILERAGSISRVSFIYVLVCFFLSMFITNDVSLITIVPFTLLTFKQYRSSSSGKKDSRAYNAKSSGASGEDFLLIHTIVMETVAANLGSMLTPVGNPQNLYLFSHYNFDIGSFLAIMAPYSLASLILILLLMKFWPGSRVLNSDAQADAASSSCPPVNTRLFAFYGVLFLICLLSVLHILDYRILLVIIIAGACIGEALSPSAAGEKHILKCVDYLLLLTFVFFFIFIGNLGNIPAIRSFLEASISGRELITGVLMSQVVSNVPAAILLSGFTQNGAGLLAGVNIGGLGTLIASMASLISYKFYAASEASEKGRYMIHFTIINVLMLVLLYGLSLIL